MSKIYFDTTPLIYFLDDEKPFSDKVFNDRLTVSLDTLILVTISSNVLSEFVFNAATPFLRIS